MSSTSVQLYEILDDYKDGRSVATIQHKLAQLSRGIVPSDSIQTSSFYANGDCELSVRIAEAIRVPCLGNILYAIEALAPEKTPIEIIEELAAMDFTHKS